MSTRSGKRIHNSFSEKVESISEIQKEKITRSKRVKEAGGEVATEKKKNIVRRPSDDVVVKSNDKTEKTSKSVRKSRRHTLRELNIPAVDYEALSDRKSIRQSRRLQKEETFEPTNVCIQESNVIGKQKKKNKKKRAVIENLENEFVEAVILTKKKASKKKKKSNSFIVEELVTGEHNKSFNKSNVSVDSFHSAAGSPANNNDNFKIEEKIVKNRDSKESSSLTPYNCVENIKVIKKRTKKTEKDKVLETLINESVKLSASNEIVKLSASNESLDSSVNKLKKGEIEDKDVNRCEKDISGTFKTKLKKKKSKVSNFKNTHNKAELTNTRKVHNNIEANIEGIDLENKTIDKEYNIDTSTSNFDSVIIPHVNETVIGLKSVSPLNNSAKKRRKSSFNNSTSTKRDTSITLLHECYKDISDNLTIKSKTQLDEIPTRDEFSHTTGSEKPTQSKSKDATYEKINLSDTNLDQTFDKSNNSFITNFNADKEFSHHNRRSSRRESGIKNSTYDKIGDSLVDITFNKQPFNNCNTEAKTSRLSLPQVITGQVSTVLNGTYDKITKDDSSSFCNSTYDKEKLDTTFERTKDHIDGDNILNLNSKSSIISSDNTDNMTDMSEDSSHTSIVSEDSRAENIINTSPLLIESSMDESQLNSESILLNKTATPQNEEAIGKIITPDKRENLSDNNKTPLKREGTFTGTKTTPLKRDGTYTELQKIPSKHQPILTEEHKPSGSGNPTTHLTREGTFTKESSDAMSPKPKNLDKTLSTRRKSTSSPGRTPFKSGSKVRVALNVTHSLDKSQRRSSIAAAPPRPTRVMFRSPVDDLNVVVAQSKGKVIKSSLKGSSKSFMFDESALEKCGSRKRSRTQDGAEDGAKRARTAGAGAGAGVYVRTASRTRTTSAAARLQSPAEAEATPPAAKSRTKLPDFAALHRKQFSKMESLDECQRRHARRARALLTPPALLTPSALVTPSALITPTTLPKRPAQLAPTASLTPIAPKGALHRNNPKETSDTVQSQAAKRPVTQRSKEIDQKNQSYTRFGFKLNLDVNPFSVPAKTVDILPKTTIKSKVLTRQATLPSLAGNTHRKEAAKQAVMREKSFSDKRDLNRNQNRTVIKGVRTNRRFELQMKMRNID